MDAPHDRFLVTACGRCSCGRCEWRTETLYADGSQRFRDSPFQPDWDVFDVRGPEGIKFDLNLLLDVDADGDLDVINSEENDNARDGKAGLGVVWYENPTR